MALQLKNNKILYRVSLGWVLSVLFAISPLMNQPQCPLGYTQAQVDAAHCNVGVNIGLALWITYVVLPLGIVAITLWAIKLRLLAKKRR